MLYLLYGGDEVLLDEALSSMKEAVGPPETVDVNVTTLDGSQASFDEVVAIASTVPFLAEKRLVIIRGLLAQFEPRPGGRAAGSSPPSEKSAMERWKGLPGYASEMPETTDLVIVDGKLKGPNPLLAKLRPVAKVITFPLPVGRDLPAWIRRRAANRGIDIEPRAVQSMADFIGPNLRVVDTELEKLSLYRGGEPIRNEDVWELVANVKEANIFATVDAVLEGRPRIAVRSAHQLLDAGRTPGYMISMLARQVRLLLLAKEIKATGASMPEIGKRLSISGFPLTKTLEQEGKLSIQKLMGIHRRLLDTDVSIKTGEVDERLGLDLLVAELASMR